MATQAQIAANHQNCLKSTGPKTTKGKSAVSQNAIKHGLTAAQAVIDSEDQIEFDLYKEQFFEELSPQTPMETMLTERVVTLSWRLKRSARIQNQTIDAMNAPKPISPLMAKLQKSHPFYNLGNLQDNNSDSNPKLSLGRLAIKDFSNDRVLERLLMYERRIENSLYKTIIELQRLNLIKNLNNDSNTTLKQQN